MSPDEHRTYWKGISDLDSLGIEFKTLLLVDQEFFDIFALITLKLNHLAHLSVVDDGPIAGCSKARQRPLTSVELCEGSGSVPNFFLMTFKIFFWSNFLGRPCTVVRVFRPLRSAPCISLGVRRHGFRRTRRFSDCKSFHSRWIRMWM